MILKCKENSVNNLREKIKKFGENPHFCKTNGNTKILKRHFFQRGSAAGVITLIGAK